MTQPYPQQPGFPPGPPQYAAQQPQQYAPPQPGGYPVQQPQYGQQPAPQYGQPQYGQAPQQYGQPAPQQAYQPPQAAMPAPASLDSYYNQPSSGWGPAWQLGVAVQDGTSYIGVVAQWITEAHLEFATQKNAITGVEEVRRFKDGQPVINQKVPLNVAPDQRFTEGRAQCYVGPGEKDLFNAALAAAGGDPSQPIPLGWMIRATKTGSRGNNFGGRSATKSFECWPPEVAQQFAQQLGIPYPDLNTPKPAPKEPRHAAPEAANNGGDGNGGNFAPAPASAGPAVQQQAALPQPVAQQLPPPPVAQAPQQAPAGPPMGMPPAPAQQAAPAPMAGPPAMGQVPNDPAKAELLARLTGHAPQPAA